jgi:hypothetical protein
MRPLYRLPRNGSVCRLRESGLMRLNMPKEKPHAFLHTRPLVVQGHGTTTSVYADPPNRDPT